LIDSIIDELLIDWFWLMFLWWLSLYYYLNSNMVLACLFWLMI